MEKDRSKDRSFSISPPEASAGLGGRFRGAFSLDDEVHGLVALGVLAEDVVLAGHDGVEDDAHEGPHGETGEAHGAEGQGPGLGVADADAQHQDQGRDEDVAGFREVHLVFHHVADAHGGDHAVEHQADAADGAAGHGGDDGRELGAEGEAHGQDRRDADDPGVIDAAQGQDAGILAVGGVGRGAEEGRQGGGKAVAEKGAVQAGVLDVVAAAGGGDGGDVADVLHHGGEAQGHDGDDGGEEHVPVHVPPGEEAEDRLVHLHRQGQEGGLADVLHQGLPDAGVKDHRQEVGAHHAQEDGDDLHHAPAPDVGGHDDADGGNGNPPAPAAVIDGGGGEVQADGDDDGARDDGREEAHDLLGAEGPDQGRQHRVDKTRAGHAEAGVGQELGVGEGIVDHGGDGGVAAQEGEGGAQEGRDLAAGDEVEEQRPQAREEQGVGDVQPRQDGDQDRGPEHGEHVLEAQQQHPSCAQGAGVIDAVLRNFVLSHYFEKLLSRAPPKAPGIKKSRNRKHRFRDLNTENGDSPGKHPANGGGSTPEGGLGNNGHTGGHPAHFLSSKLTGRYYNG